MGKIEPKPLFLKGHGACAGCGSAIAMHMILRGLGDDAIVSLATGCMEVVSTGYPDDAWNVPVIHSLFENAPAVASGVSRALKKLGKKGVSVAIGGDGASYDISFGALSGAMERNEDMIYVVYDNEAYENCLSTSSLIMTAEGLKPITEVKVGDSVYAFNQKTYGLVLKKCTGVFNNGVKPVYELGTLHHSIKATSNHPFLVLKRNGRGRANDFVWKTLEQVDVGDYVVTLKNSIGLKSYVFNPIKASKLGDYKVNKIKSVSLPLKSSPDLMEYLGMYVGDGWTRLDHAETGFALPAGTRERERLIELQYKLFGIQPTSTDKYYVITESVNLARFIDSLGFGHGAKNKTIPSWVFTLPHDEKEAFLSGLMQSDGYAFGKSLRYASASLDLVKRLRLFLQTMGYRVGKIHSLITPAGTECAGRQPLKESVCAYVCFSKRRPWNTAKYVNQYRYQNFLVENKYFDTEQVTYKKFVGSEPTLDLRVADEHNFVADGIVVHNTGIQRSGATPKYAATTTSPQEVGGKGEWKKNLSFIGAAHGIPYAATASIAYPGDLQKKLQKAKALKGFRLITVFAGCQLGWRHEPSLTIEVARKAVATGMWNLYEIEGGVFKRTFKPKELEPVENYLKLQGRFKHLKPQQIAEIQERIKKTQAELDKLEASGVNLSQLL